MPLHLIKLCVGCDTIGELEDWIAERRRKEGRGAAAYRHRHITRMAPKRAGELVEGGSLYWVIRGQLACRQALRAVEPFTDRDGVARCALLLDPAPVPVSPRPCRPFQGWRYLEDQDAPADLGRDVAGALSAMPEELRRELVTLGLL